MDAPRRKPLPLRLAQGLLLALLTLAVLEGLASLTLVAYDLVFNSRSAASEREAEYTAFDPEIGWISRPNVRLEDLFGPGASLSTDALGARGRAAVEREVPAGKLRVVCVGDSFTQGYGVGDEDTWPQAMQDLDPRLEVVNLGQRGYGIDQAYLWYLRKAPQIEHEVVLLAFIADDWRRVRFDRYQGYSKPLLVRTEDGPRVANAPLSPPGARWGWWHLNRELLRSPRTIRFLERVLRKLGRRPRDSAVLSSDQGADVVAQVFEDLDRRCRAADRRLVLVYLPSRVPETVGGIVPLEGEARRVCEAAQASGIALVDLTGDLAALPAPRRDDLFLDLAEVVYPWAQNHYNAAGNRFVAEALHGRLTELGVLPPAATAPR